MTTKQIVLEAIRKLPDDATIEDVLDTLHFLAKVQQGLEQSEHGEVITHADAKKRLLK